MPNLLLRKGRVLDPSRSLDQQADVRIREGRIAEIAPDLQPQPGEHSIECEGWWVCPGLIDLHVHLREPGQTYKEDIESGSQAAVAGGFTAVCCMPNTDPPLDNPTLVQELRRRAEQRAACSVYPVAALTKGMKGEELCDYAALKAAGAVAVSDDGFPLQSAKVMEQAMRWCAAIRLPVATHCEDQALTAGGSLNEGVVSTQLGLQGMPAIAEASPLARNALLALATGCRLHIQHLSTALGLELVRFFKRVGAEGRFSTLLPASPSFAISAEVTPHHLLLTEEACEGFRTEAKMNPPLRTQQDVEALALGLQEGTIECIATDHAPHAAFEKALPFARAPFGIVGLETAVGCVLTWNARQREPLSPLKLVSLMSTHPATLFNLPGGTLAIGAPADITVIDPQAHWSVRPEKFRSKGRNTPFTGWELTGKVRMTLVKGQIVYRAG